MCIKINHFFSRTPASFSFRFFFPIFSFTIFIFLTLYTKLLIYITSKFIEGEELMIALRKQLLYYFSRENLSTDSFLCNNLIFFLSSFFFFFKFYFIISLWQNLTLLSSFSFFLLSFIQNKKQNKKQKNKKQTINSVTNEQ